MRNHPIQWGESKLCKMIIQKNSFGEAKNNNGMEKSIQWPDMNGGNSFQLAWNSTTNIEYKQFWAPKMVIFLGTSIRRWNQVTA